MKFCCKCGDNVGHQDAITVKGHHYLGTDIHYTFINGNLICGGCWKEENKK